MLRTACFKFGDHLINGCDVYSVRKEGKAGNSADFQLPATGRILRYKVQNPVERFFTVSLAFSQPMTENTIYFFHNRWVCYKAHFIADLCTVYFDNIRSRLIKQPFSETTSFSEAASESRGNHNEHSDFFFFFFLQTTDHACDGMRMKRFILLPSTRAWFSKTSMTDLYRQRSNFTKWNDL